MLIASAEEIHQIATRTVAAFPAALSRFTSDVFIQVLDLPTSDMLADLGLADPLELTGLYDGVPLPEKSAFDQPQAPDTIYLFRYPILAELADRPGVTLKQLVSHITVHEFAHHFGWSDEDIARIDPWWL